ncbi:MAG: hypothetical protein JW787_12285 [Sedimentisphaerales bacterium]|nr:hypothetical protein [Sedimentisphaerales bacterium]
MKKYKSYCLAAFIFISLFQLASGSITSPVKLALKHTSGQSESYRLQTVSQRKVSIEGLKPENADILQGGQTTDKIEILFDKQIQSTDSKGNAVEKITIKELKYFAEVRDKAVLDFNSTKDKNPNNALAALIGQSYTIEVTPSGKVAKIIDVNNARTAIKSIPSNNEPAARLLSDKTIERHHSIPLPDANNNELKINDTWSKVTSFDFGLMGQKAYERTYKLSKTEKSDTGIYAVIDMSAIPSVAGIKESEGRRPAALPMTDIRQTYTGQMKIDITNGTLLKYQENLKSEWLIVPPNSGQSGPPSVLNMTAIQSYDIEKIK